MERQGSFDYILLETSGLADPGNIAPLFWVDDGLGSTIYLDGIVTVVDAKNIIRSLESPATDEVATGSKEPHARHRADTTTAHLQISHADMILLNKADTVAAGALGQIKERVQSINGLAEVVTTQYGQVPELQGTILDLHAYEDVGPPPASRWGHSHMDPVRHALAPENYCRIGSLSPACQTISTVTLDLPALKDGQLEKLDLWLQRVLWESELPMPESSQNLRDPVSVFEIHRVKGLIILASGGTKMLQGVREVFEITERASIPNTSTKTLEHGKIVLIGKGVRNVSWEKSLINVLTN